VLAPGHGSLAALEDLGAVRLRDTDATVVDRELGNLPGRAQGHCDGADRAELECVREQVLGHLLERERVPLPVDAVLQIRLQPAAGHAGGWRRAVIGKVLGEAGWPVF